MQFPANRRCERPQPGARRKSAPNPEQYVERELLTETLREIGYYLQAPPRVQGKLN